MRVAIVGAGLAGLACARELAGHGLEVIVLEGSSRVGGRIGSRSQEGFTLDAGFQVFLPAYPTPRAMLDLPALDLRRLDAGALVWNGQRLESFVLDPRRPRALVRALGASWFTLEDRWLLARLTLDVASLRNERILLERSDLSTMEYWRSYGFSHGFIETFLAPFFSGVCFDARLETDARLFRFYWKMMALAGAALPAMGMQAIPDQLARGLGPQAVRLGAKVAQLVRRGAGVTGVRLETGETLEADVVVLAAALPEVSRLTGYEFALEGRSVTNLAFAHRRPWVKTPTILLNAAPGRLVNQVLPSSVVSPAYAPPGEHLSLVQVLGNPAMDDQTLVARCRSELETCFSGAPCDDWRLLRIDRIAFGQFRERPFDLEHLPGARLGPRLYLASEALYQSSIEGAMRGGVEAARLVVSDLNRQLVLQTADASAR